MASSRLLHPEWLFLQRRRTLLRRTLSWAASIGFMLAFCCASRAQSRTAALPDAPLPQPEYMARNRPLFPGALAPAPDPGGQEAFPPALPAHRGENTEGLRPNWIPLPHRCIKRSCSAIAPQHSCCQSSHDAFRNYLQRYAVHIYTPHELGKLAISGVADPFNLLTILGTSAYSVAINPHSPYGPGVRGIAEQSGVTLSQDMTGEFFGTFLIPSLDHQDPHYRRLPNMPLARRIAHCAYQIFWTDSDTGQGMVNYSTILGSIADEAVGVTYLPYQRTSWGASAERIALGWATDPVGNYITEFVPDVASHINIRIVFLQRIINRVAIEEGATAP